MELIQESSSSVSTVCQSYHLTSFAVLVSAKHEPEQVTKQFPDLWCTYTYVFTIAN